LYPTLALRPFDVAEHKRKAKRINEVENREVEMGSGVKP